MLILKLCQGDGGQVYSEDIVFAAFKSDTLRRIILKEGCCVFCWRSNNQFHILGLFFMDTVISLLFFKILSHISRSLSLEE